MASQHFWTQLWCAPIDIKPRKASAHGWAHANLGKHPYRQDFDVADNSHSVLRVNAVALPYCLKYPLHGVYDEKNGVHGLWREDTMT